MAQTATVSRIGDITQAPRTASDTSTHYGYCAFKSINLTGPNGREYWVQPEHSPFMNELPARQLIPFTNFEIGVPDEVAASQKGMRFSAIPIIRKQRTAKECASEIEDAYQQWSFTILHPITGMDYDTAFRVFETIQPFVYLLKDLPSALGQDAIQRIAATEPHTVSYGDSTVTLDPLPDDLKATAEAVRVLMLRCAEFAVRELAGLRVETTTQQLTQFFATGKGKEQADPHDKYCFEEMGAQIPSIVGKPGGDGNGNMIGDLVTALRSAFGAGGAQPVQATAAGEPVEVEAPAVAEPAFDARDIEIEMLRNQIATLEKRNEKLADRRNPAIKDPDAIPIGAKVQFEGRNAIVVKKPFGKHIIKFEDGTQATVTKEELTR